MKKFFISLSVMLTLTAGVISAQDLKAKDVPDAVKAAFTKKYPAAAKVSWEKEDGNYEANWGGKSGEDNTAQFSPKGVFVEYALALEVKDLPANVKSYVKTHYNGAAIKEAAKVTDAAGTVTLEAEIKGKEIIFDAAGNFLKEKAGE